MTSRSLAGAASERRSHSWLPVLLVLFVGSGAAALIYEIVWFQLLQLVIGSSAVSLGVLLGTFMGGMCLGSLLLPRVISPRRHPLRVYALLELGTGIIGILVLLVMPLVDHVYTAWGGYGLTGYLLRGLIASICLLPPTLLMGATLPAISRYMETTPEGVAWLGFFYGGNIGGAVFGSLFAGFYLLRVYDAGVATYVAVAVNFSVAALAYALATVAAYRPPASDEPAAVAPGRTADAATIYVAIALSGLCALAAEVIWTRMLGLLFGASVYTFSIILAVFLIGLGIGSSIGSVLSRTMTRPRAALGWCQMLIAAAIAWTAYMLSDSLPYWPINPSISTGIWFNFQLDMVRALWAILPATILWGASFPLALASLATEGQDPGRLVGGVYAANTVGAIVGSLAASLVLVYWFGSQHAQQILIAVSALAGLLVLTGSASPRETKSRWRWVGSTSILAAVAVAALLARAVPAVPGLLVAYGRYAATWVGQSTIIYMGEGLNSSVAVSELPSGVRNYHNAGKVQASSEPQDMRLQRMLGHLTTLVPRHADSVLVIGCGAGVTAGAVSISPDVKQLTIAEIEPLVPRVVSTYFARENYDVVRNPKTRVFIDDARHYLLTSREKFDAVTSDPLDPWVKGAAMLYTSEFFDVVKAHLKPGGVVTLFVQLYESNDEAVKSEVATFLQAFPNGLIFGNTDEGRGYDMVLLGQVEPTTIDLDTVDARLANPAYGQVAQSLREVGFNSAVDLFSTYAGRRADLMPWLKGAAINRDRNLRLQYLAGLGLNLYESGSIYSEMMAYERYPSGVFTGSPERLQALRDAIERAPGR
ncbi:MAG TPA: fused MFS/spermidine synthase [Vicinamibacterales bacterium]|nr:fused MFS/spermidine synthase [Vicinamibacterales bacterium]